MSLLAVLRRFGNGPVLVDPRSGGVLVSIVSVVLSQVSDSLMQPEGEDGAESIPVPKGPVDHW